MPSLARDALDASELCEDGGQGVFAVRRELQGLSHEIDGPAEDDLARVPTAVSAGHLLDRCGFADVP